MKKYQAPTKDDSGKNSIFVEAELHPAFGCCVISHWNATPGVRLFGSDMVHGSGVSLTFKTAEKYRDLHHDRHHGRELLLEVDMSHSQWARLVSGHGIGEGVPVTISMRQDGKLVDVPAIAAPQATKKERHGEELRNTLADAIATMRGAVQRLGGMLDTGKVGVRDLRALHRDLEIEVGRLPANVQFAADTFVELTEKLADDARSEIEAHVAAVAKHLGVESMAALPRLPAKPGSAS